MDLEALAERVKAGDARSVSRLITLIENQDADGAALLKRLQPSNSKAEVIGITGYPGAGKSTLIAQLVTAYRRQHMTVAILAIDTSSPVSGGAILGDRMRMQEHYLDRAGCAHRRNQGGRPARTDPGDCRTPTRVEDSRPASQPISDNRTRLHPL